GDQQTESTDDGDQSGDEETSLGEQPSEGDRSAGSGRCSVDPERDAVPGLLFALGLLAWTRRFGPPYPVSKRFR
ncbi:MAG TPA: hypothetical protein VK034_24265, partial [Enhygromyxa sp.]|nr:hypothetical protein [Enhygromyxa sp.]